MSVERITLEKEAKKYEAQTKNTLIKKVPVFIRIDGKSFKTFVKGFDRPFDYVLHTAMQKTMKSLCEEVQGCVFGWTNSDEITIVITDYKNWNSVPWLDYDVQKICSVVASTATLEFNRIFRDLINTLGEDEKKKYQKALSVGAKFEVSCFNVPEDRVSAMVFWRQNDCRRKAIQRLSRIYFERKEIIGKCNNDLLEMLRNVGVEWNDFPTKFRRGSCCIRRIDKTKNKIRWSIDDDLDMLSENSQYIKSIMDAARVDDEY